MIANPIAWPFNWKTPMDDGAKDASVKASNMGVSIILLMINSFVTHNRQFGAFIAYHVLQIL